MKLTPLQINAFLSKIGFTVVGENVKKQIWRYRGGQPLFVNMERGTGKSALVIDPGWLGRITELQQVHGVTPGARHVYHSNMNVFPKRLNKGREPTHYGLPITLDDESSLLGLLRIIYPELGADRSGPFILESVSETSLHESRSISHSDLLGWFSRHTGHELTWMQLLQAPSTVTISAKGIYKPKELVYALSIRQTLDSPYRDQEPDYQENGSWHYSYAQEESPRGNSADLFTNQGLKRCMDDGVPVAVLVQLSKKPNVTKYRLLGLAKVISWRDGVFTLESTTLAINDTAANFTAEHSTAYSPTGVIDNRRRTLTEITQRQGQGSFRSGLLTAYEGRCAITDYAVEEVLEAAHITPYLGPETNHISNGLLLRSDLHTLWDRGLIYLCDELKLRLRPSLASSEYASLAGKKIRDTAGSAPAPSIAAIRAHRKWCLRTD